MFLMIHKDENGANNPEPEDEDEIMEKSGD